MRQRRDVVAGRRLVAPGLGALALATSTLMHNPFVVGASDFPQNAAYNPSGTVGSLAYNAADAIISRYLNSPGKLA